MGSKYNLIISVIVSIIALKKTHKSVINRPLNSLMHPYYPYLLF